MEPITLALVRTADQIAMPWRNGGGLTYEIAREPDEGAGFDWRFSRALVARSGPFSTFPGCSRVLTLLDGGGFRLRFDEPDGGPAEIVVDGPCQPVAFDGDRGCRAELLDGPCTVANLIVNRARCSHRIERLPAGGGRASVALARWTLLFAVGGALAVSVDARYITLGPGECLRLDAASGRGDSMVGIADNGEALLVRLDPKPDQ